MHEKYNFKKNKILDTKLVQLDTKTWALTESTITHHVKPESKKNLPGGKSTPHVNSREKKNSPAGNRTPVSRVTGGDTNHYTTEDYESTIAR